MNLTEKNIINFLTLTRKKARAALGITTSGGVVENYGHWKLASFKGGNVSPNNGLYANINSENEVVLEGGQGLVVTRISENGGLRQKIVFDALPAESFQAGDGIQIDGGSPNVINVKLSPIASGDAFFFDLSSGGEGGLGLKVVTGGGIEIAPTGLQIDDSVVLTENSTPTLVNPWTFNAPTFVRAAASNAVDVTHFPVFTLDPDAPPAKEIRSIQKAGFLAALDAHWVAKTDFSSLGTPLSSKISNTIDATTFKNVYFKSSGTIQISQIPSEASDQVTLNFDAQGLYDIQGGEAIEINTHPDGTTQVINLKRSGSILGEGFQIDNSSLGEGGLGLKFVDFGGITVAVGAPGVGGLKVDSTVVRTTSINQTIAGIKTFSNFPELPTVSPTTDYQAVHKKYVDDRFYNSWRVKIGTSAFQSVLSNKQVEFIAGTGMGLVQSVTDGNVTITINGQVQAVTNLSHSRDASGVTINSSTGTNTTIPLVDTFGAGFVSPTMLSNWDAAYNHSTNVSGAVHGATPNNTVNMIVRRDASGNFSAGTITATLSGNATSANTATTANALNTANDYQVRRLGVNATPSVNWNAIISGTGANNGALYVGGANPNVYVEGTITANNFILI